MTFYFTKKIRAKIGRNIRRIRKKRKLRQVDVAVYAGLSQSFYGRIERGTANLSLEKLYRMIKALNVSSAEILPF